MTFSWQKKNKKNQQDLYKSIHYVHYSLWTIMFTSKWKDKSKIENKTLKKSCLSNLQNDQKFPGTK